MAYALGAFVIGVARHTPYSELLRGASLWVRAPFWLQGAFLGVFVVVPVAVVAEMIALGRRMAARSAWSGEMGRVVALALSALMAAPALTLPRSAHGVALAGSAARFAFADARQLEQAAAEGLVNEPPGIPEADPAHLLEVAGAAVRGFRSEEWEVGALAASLGNDPAAAFAFVRDAIAFDPYAGVLRGAEGTLAARAGNAWDRALLLRALLDKSGSKTRLAFATLDGQTATGLIKRAFQRPVRSLSAPAQAGLLSHVVSGVAARARRDAAALRLALGSRINELGVEDAELLRQQVAQHAWVQMLKGDAWIDLDPTLPDAQIGKSLVAAANGTAEDVPPEQQHTVVVRVIAETLADEKLSETVSLERELPAATAAHQYLLLRFAPEGGGGGLLKGTTSPSSFVPTLLVGDKEEAGRAIATKAGGGGAGFGSFFGGDEDSGGELVGLYIEIETRVPGRRPTVARHVLLDRVPPDARSASSISAGALRPLAPDGGVPRAMTGLHHVMISTGGSSSLDMARLRLSALDATSAAQPLWGCDLTLVEGSERLVVRALDSTERGRAYVDEPRVFLGSWFPDASGTDVESRETDLLIDSVRVLLPEPTSVREIADRQLQYGALESALETETTLRLAAGWDPADRAIVSTSLALGRQLTVLAPSDVERLPAGSAGALRKALRAGDLAVVSGDVAKATAWWTVARSGFVRAIMESGAGMSAIVKTGANRYKVVRKMPASKVTPRGHSTNESAEVTAEMQAASQEGGKAVGEFFKTEFVQAAKKLMVL